MRQCIRTDAHLQKPDVGPDIIKPNSVSVPKTSGCTSPAKITFSKQTRDAPEGTRYSFIIDEDIESPSLINSLDMSLVRDNDIKSGNLAFDLSELFFVDDEIRRVTLVHFQTPDDLTGPPWEIFLSYDQVETGE